MKTTTEDNEGQPGDFYDVREVAEKLGRCSTRTVHRYVQQKFLPPPFEIGGRRFWLPSDVADFIAKQLQKRQEKRRR